MNKIEKMIQEMCPDGVEWKKLGEICEIKKGKQLNKELLTEFGKYPAYNGGKTFSGRTDEYNVDSNTIIISQGGASAGYVNFVEEPFWANAHCYYIIPNESKSLNRYLYHFIKFKQNYFMNLQYGSGIPALKQSILLELPIPIPTLEIQEEIVKVLDIFEKCATELQAELQAELQQRYKQYSYYRDMMLSEEYLNKISNKLLKEKNKFILTTLGEIGEFTRGNGLQKSDFMEEGNPVIHYGQIYTKYNFSTEKVVSYVNKEIFEKLRKAKKNDLLIATTSENIEDVGKCLIWLGEKNIGFSGDMYSYSTKENSKYIAYYFQTTEFQKQKERKVTGTKLIRIHGDDMAKFLIPLPHISIQNKVVEVLDKFQDYINDTKGLLPKEIEQRRKQYEYYREKLLTFDEKYDRDETRRDETRRGIINKSFFKLLKEASELVGVQLTKGVEWKKLKEVSSYYDGTHQTPKYVDFGVPFISVQNIKNIYSKDKFISFEDFEKYKIKPKKNDVFMTRIGDIGTCALVENDENLAYYVTLSLIRPSNILISKYLKYFIESSYGKRELFKRTLHNATPIKINLSDIGEIKIPILPLEVQQYIVEKLDKFDKLVNDIKEGLPKEIELRQKQYEYYREKLLNFEK